MSARGLRRRGLAAWRVPLGFAAAAALVMLAHPTGRSLAVGLPLAVVGLGWRAAAAGHIHKNDQLATAGPYRYCRNPLYLGSALLAAGLVIASAQWLLALLAVILLLAVYMPVIRGEERFLAERFGAAFEEYRRVTPRLVPRLVPPAATATRYSFPLYRRHREYNALLGFLALCLALWAAYLWGPLASHL